MKKSICARLGFVLGLLAFVGISGADTPPPLQTCGTGGLYMAAYSPDGTKILTAGAGGAFLWDATSGARIQKFWAPRHAVLYAAFSPDGTKILTGSRDESAKLWNVETGAVLRTYWRHPWGVYWVGFSPDGTKLLMPGISGTELRDVATGAIIATFPAGGGGNAVSVPFAFSPDETRILVGYGYQGYAKLFDANSSAEISTFAEGNQFLTCLGFSPTENKILTGSWDKTVKVWDLNSPTTPVLAFSGHTSEVECAAFSPDGTKIMSGEHYGDEHTKSGLTKIWDVATGALIHNLSGHASWTSSVAFSPDETRVLTGNRDSSVIVWNLETDLPFRIFKWHTKPVGPVAFSPDGTKVLTGCSDGSGLPGGSARNTADLYDTVTGELIRTFWGHGYFVLSVAFSPDGTKVLTGSGDSTIAMWDVNTGEVIEPFIFAGGHTGWVESVAFSADGNRVLSGSRDHTAKLWDANTGDEIRTFSGHSDAVNSVVFSPAGTKVLTGSSDGTAKLWDVNNGVTPLLTLTGSRGPIRSVVFSPDGGMIATSSTTSTPANPDLGGGWSVELWDPNTGNLIRTLTYANWPYFPVVSLSFSPDGSMLLAGGERNAEAIMWDVNTGIVVRRFWGHAYAVNGVAFSADGTRVVTGSGDGTACIWNSGIVRPNDAPNKASNVSPVDGTSEVSLTPVLYSSPFSDPNSGDTHAASQWQIRAAGGPTTYVPAVYDSDGTTAFLTSITVLAGRLNYSTSYYWHVRYKDNNGEWSAWSNETLFTTETHGVTNTLPSTPVDLSPPDGQIGVSVGPLLALTAFSDADTGDFQTASQWRVRTAAGSYSVPTYDSGSVLSAGKDHIIPQGYLSGGIVYFWQGRYCDSRNGWSDWSPETTFTTVAGGAVAVPEGLRAAAGAKSVWLTWMLHSNAAVIGYNVFRAESSSGPWTTQVNPETVRGNEYLDQDLTPGMTYYYRLAAVTEGDVESAMTEPVSAVVGSSEIFMNDVRGTPGETISQMITVNNPNQISNKGLQIEVLYDKDMLTPISLNKTVLTEGFSLSDNLTAANGHIIIAGSSLGSSAIVGEGHVLELVYEVSGAAIFWSTSELGFDFVEMVDDSAPARAVDVDYSATATMTVAASILLGDLDGNARVTILDEVLLQQIILGEILPTETQRLAGDINGDSLLDSADMVLIRRIIMEGGAGIGSYPMLRTASAETQQLDATSHLLSWGEGQSQGTSVTISARIDDLQGIAGMDLVVNFDPAKLDFVSTEPGESTIGYETWEEYEEDGQIRIVMANSLASSAGSGEVADFTFTVKGSWDEASLIVAKIKLSGENGENLVRTRNVQAEDGLLTYPVSTGTSFWQLYE